MTMKILALLALAVAGASAIGCAGPDLQGRVDELTREQEELQRQKEQTESELLVYKARVEAMEKDKDRRSAPKAAPAPAPSRAPDSDGMDIRKRGNETIINLPSDVMFSSGSASLSGSGEKSMAKIVDYIRKNHPGGTIRVEGHSDSDPIRRTKSKFHCNWELSFERAHAVMHHLVDKAGVDPHMVVCEAFGEFHPVSSNDKAKNRRVEIVLSN